LGDCIIGYTEPLLDQRTANYNARIAAGDVFDEEGFPVTQKVEMFELEIDRPNTSSTMNIW
jgi:cytochrome c-type biogenesis protein CcmF